MNHKDILSKEYIEDEIAEIEEAIQDAENDIEFLKDELYDLRAGDYSEDEEEILENRIAEAQEAFDDIQDEYSDLLESLKDALVAADNSGCLIRESYFESYVQELIEEQTSIPSYVEVDWEATAENIKHDYTEIDIDGVTYYYHY